MVLQRWQIELKGADLDRDLDEDTFADALRRALDELSFEGVIEPTEVLEVDLDDEYHVEGIME